MTAPHQTVPTPARSCVSVRKQRVIGAKVLPPEDDFLAIEDPLEITISDADGGTNRLVTMRTPGDDVDLIYGYLFTEGVIERTIDIASIEFPSATSAAAPTRAFVQLASGRTADLTHRQGAVQSSCGVCGADSLGSLALEPELRINDDSRVDAALIHSLPERMRGEQAVFAQTGGLHAAAIFSAHNDELLASREDIGRHNALDKAIGANLQAKQASQPGQALCVSGRMSYEIIQKALRARMAIVAGVGAPSSLAVSIANDFNLTLVGFLRDGAFNIYSCPERIL